MTGQRVSVCVWRGLTTFGYSLVPSSHRRLCISASRLYALSWLSFCSWPSWGKVSSAICFKYLSKRDRVGGWVGDHSSLVYKANRGVCVRASFQTLSRSSFKDIRSLAKLLQCTPTAT